MTSRPHYDTLRVEAEMKCDWCENAIEEGEEVAGGSKYSPKFFCSDRCYAKYEADMYAAACDVAYERARDEKLMGEWE